MGVSLVRTPSYSDDGASLSDHGFAPEKSKGLIPVVSAVQAVEQSDLWTASSLSEEHLEIVYSHIEDKTFDEWLEILKKAVAYHNKDPLLGPHKHAFLKELSEGPLPHQSEDEWHGLVAFEGFVIHEWSIYDEVRNVTQPIDEADGDDYVTLRVYVISAIWAMGGSVVDTFFSTRSPHITISTMALQLLIAGSGQLWALLPEISFPIGFGKRCVLNNGKPWSFKEQMLATLGMTVAAGSPYSQDVIISQGNDYFYGFDNAKKFGYMITLTLSTAFMGFGFGGLFRSMLVYPSKMAWFSMLSNLPISRVFSQPDVRENVNGWKLKRGEFVGIITLFAFCWYWIVTNVLSFMSYFNWICYIAPNNVDANAITGLWTGLGMQPFQSFDFTFAGYFGGILTPVYAYANQIFGLFIGCFAVLAVWYTNTLYTGYFPINSNLLYNNEGRKYNIFEVLDPVTKNFDMDRYQKYSLPYWSAYNIVSYGAFFMVFPLSFVYAILNYGVFMLEGFKTMSTGLTFWKRDGKRAIDTFDDSFCRRQARYREVPEWFYFLILVCAFGMGIGCVEGYSFTDTPVWAIILGIVLAFVFVPISGVMYATTGSSFETNVLYELIIGMAREGHDQTLLVSKCFATNFFGQADNWITNQKIAHYSGISPWAITGIQMMTTAMVSFVQVGIMTFQLNGGIRDMCNPKNREYFRCNGVRTYFNASVMWGVIGPRRVFDGLYPAMKWCFLIGAFVPFPLWAWRTFGPKLASKAGLKPKSWSHWLVAGSGLIYVNEMLICTSLIEPTLGGVLSDWYIHLAFQLYIRPRFPRWWTKYSYLIISGLSIGSGWAAFFNFWATQYHNVVYMDAWTNNVVSENMDYNYAAVRFQVQEGEYFGPRKGTFPR